MYINNNDLAKIIEMVSEYYKEQFETDTIYTISLDADKTNEESNLVKIFICKLYGKEILFYFNSIEKIYGIETNLLNGNILNEIQMLLSKHIGKPTLYNNDDEIQRYEWQLEEIYDYEFQTQLPSSFYNDCYIKKIQVNKKIH